MTTIAWDGKLLAADRLISTSGVLVTGPKLFRIEPRWVVAVCGQLTAAMEMVEWLYKYSGNGILPNVNHQDAHIISWRDGQLGVYDLGRRFPTRLTQERMAFGSGAQAALGALYSMVSAKDAVQIASRVLNGKESPADFYNTETDTLYIDDQPYFLDYAGKDYKQEERLVRQEPTRSIV